jgi:hypothetical protein
MVGANLFIAVVAIAFFHGVQGDFAALARYSQKSQQLTKELRDWREARKLALADAAAGRSLDDIGRQGFTPMSANEYLAGDATIFAQGLKELEVRKAALIKPDPGARILVGLEIALGVPLVFLGLGAAMLWAFAGFRPNPN